MNMKPKTIGFYWFFEKDFWTIVEVFNNSGNWGCLNYFKSFKNVKVQFMDGRVVSFNNLNKDSKWGSKITGKEWDERLQQMETAAKAHKASWEDSPDGGVFY